LVESTVLANAPEPLQEERCIDVNRLIFVALAVVLCANVVFAQNAGVIGIYADPDPGPPVNRAITDAGGLVRLYFWHVGADQVVSSSFKLELGGLGWSIIGEAWAFGLVLGTGLTGVAISYEFCLSGDIYLGSINFLGNNAPDCSLIWIAPNPVAVTGRIEAFDCDSNKIYPMGYAATVNPDGVCPVPVQETTWGKVKSLYQ
jgi:hypothetical protein